jgi:prophage antirepressor-like protein
MGLMNDITTFNNKLFGTVRTLKIDEKYYFVGKDIAEALGYKRPSDAISQHCKHTVKYRIPDITGVEQQMNIIPESDVYRLIIKSKLPEAEKFEEWVMEEVLPQLRQCGVVITESATQEAIDYQSKYGTRRIRNTFRETTNLIETWNEFKELSKLERDAHRIDNDDRIKCCNIIIDELQNYIANNNLEMKTYEVVMYQEVMMEIKDEITRLSNKKNGGIKSNMTRKINDLEHSKQEWIEYAEGLETYINEYEMVRAPERDLSSKITLDIHPFSANAMYEGGHKTPAYIAWRRKFRSLEIPSREDYEIYEGIDFNKPLGLYIRFVAIEDMDTDNKLKAFQDMLFNHFDIADDNIVRGLDVLEVGTCQSWEDGRITFALWNLSQKQIDKLKNK